MRTQVDIMIEGIPSHAWTTETAAEILGSSCLVESLAPETENREDLSLFKLRAWCIDPDEVPVAKRIWVPEPEVFEGPAARRAKSCALLEYKTFIHIGRVRDHEGLERWLRPPSSDGSGQSRMSDDSEDFSGRGEWRVLPWTRGVRDHRGGAPASEVHGGSYLHSLTGRIGPSEWRIPPMARGTEATARAPVITTAALTTGARRQVEGTAGHVPPAAAQREVAVVRAPHATRLAIEDPGSSRGARPTPEAAMAVLEQRRPIGSLKQPLTKERPGIAWPIMEACS
ncbi:hypothetical protein VPH35_051614 [Triticum aestivum]